MVVMNAMMTISPMRPTAAAVVNSRPNHCSGSPIQAASPILAASVGSTMPKGIASTYPITGPTNTDAVDQIPRPKRRTSRIAAMTNRAIAQLDALPKPAASQNGAGYAPQPAEYLMPTGSRVKPMVITTTPDTRTGMNFRICGMK